MTEFEVDNKLRKIFGEVLKVEINEQDNMHEVNSWDSLRHINLVMQIEKTFNISFEFFEVIDMTNYETIKNLVIQKVKDR